MAKKRSIWKFTILAIFIVIGLVLTFASFGVPGTVYHYNGFINSIPLGLDLSGGVSAVYQASLSSTSNTQDLNSAIESTITRLESILYDEGFSEATVVRQGSDKIRVEVPNLTDTSELFDVIGEPASLYITLDSSFNVNNPTGDYVSGEDISNVYVSYNQEDSAYGVVLEFTSTGSDEFAAITEEAANNSSTIYVFIGNDDPLSLTATEKITGGSTFISGGSIVDYESAKAYSMQIMSGTFSAKLTLTESNVVSATLGKDALLYGLIAAGVAIFIVMVIMFLRYGELGLLANVSLVIYIILMCFFLQAIPFVQLTLPGLAGIILSIGMAVDGNVIIFERIKEEYASGKKIPLSVKNGFKKAFWPIFDSNITTIFAAIILYILGTASIKGFAITLLLGILLSMFTTLVVSRYLVKWYLPFNSTNAKRLRLKRSKNLNPECVIVDESIASQKTTSEEIIVEGGDEKWNINLKRRV